MTHLITATILMSLLTFFGCGHSKAPEYPSDTLTARDGREFTFYFFKHASLAVEVGGKWIYVDPVADYAVDQAVEAVKAIHPAIFYPYHYGEVDEKTDLDRLARELEGVTEVRIRPLE